MKLISGLLNWLGTLYAWLSTFWPRWIDPPTIYDESRLYVLPYEGNFFVSQGYMTNFSHEGCFALDFVMIEGTRVLAARAGVVTEVKEDASEACFDGVPECWDTANSVTITHEDGSAGWYVHLQQYGACVEVGQAMEQGDVIGLSGHTGYSSNPHLHFEVLDTDIEPTFADVEGDGIPKTSKYYTSANTGGTDYCA